MTEALKLTKSTKKIFTALGVEETVRMLTTPSGRWGMYTSSFAGRVVVHMATGLAACYRLTASDGRTVLAALEAIPTPHADALSLGEQSQSGSPARAELVTVWAELQRLYNDKEIAQ